MPLNAAGVASAVNSTYQAIVATNDNSTSLAIMGASWQSAVHSDASAGVNPIANSSAPASAGIIGAAYTGLAVSKSGNIDILAGMFADYWATSHLTPVAPCVVIFGNDAATKVGAYKAAIKGVLTTKEKTPYFDTLFAAMESVTKTIIWTGADSMGVPMTGTVS
jgi:hypothetical protein